LTREEKTMIEKYFEIPNYNSYGERQVTVLDDDAINLRKTASYSDLHEEVKKYVEAIKPDPGMAIY